MTWTTKSAYQAGMEDGKAGRKQRRIDQDFRAPYETGYTAGCNSPARRVKRGKDVPFNLGA